jgi:hypothetical protein
VDFYKILEITSITVVKKVVHGRRVVRKGPYYRGCGKMKFETKVEETTYSHR